jgi:hypothetical protein
MERAQPDLTPPDGPKHTIQAGLDEAGPGDEASWPTARTMARATGTCAQDDHPALGRRTGRVHHRPAGFCARVSLLRASWGPCRGCPADLDGNGVVGLRDHIMALERWE